MATLPYEMIEDILRRLPVKSLKRFRCVAKSWCFLIDSEKFIKSHLKRSLATNSHRRLILGGLGVFTLDLDNPNEAHAVKPPFYYKSIDGISNSCNGLVLVLSEPPVIWNPFTADYKKLPGVCHEHPAPPESYSKTAYGFAYDERNDDYKVVRVVEHRNERSHVWILSRTEIYSLKSNSWRVIENFKYPLPFLRGNWRVHVNGALHTLAEEMGPGNARIMAFDVETEKHSELKMPAEMRKVDAKGRPVDLVLDMVGGCLSVICSSRSRVDIWVMKEYGVRESWTKLLTLRPPDIEKNDTVKSLVYSKDGTKVLLNIDDKKLVWYDLKEKTVEELRVEKGMPFVFYAEDCVESLVSVVNNETVEVKKPVLIEKNKGKKVIRKKRDDFLSEGFKLVL